LNTKIALEHPCLFSPWTTVLNYTHTKNLLAGKFSGVYLPSEQTKVYSFAYGGGGGAGWHNTCARHMVKDHYQLFMCIVVYVNNLSMVFSLSLSLSLRHGKRISKEEYVFFVVENGSTTLISCYIK
jgi:hypothetical protein